MPRGGVYEFYILAAVVGFVMGGIQSLSRSTYSKLMPVTRDTASFFSFFDVTEKIAIVIGMFSFGFINELTGSQLKYKTRTHHRGALNILHNKCLSIPARKLSMP